MKTLRQLYAEHHGKLSDRWSQYLETYDTALAEFRQRPVRMLEIGVQNGGSLEVWPKFLVEGARFIGCDINPACGLLRYEDPRISVVVGDATDAAVRGRILELSARFDIVIDDGSHTSRDIVRAFDGYFPLIDDGGLFIAEDLHCSYWEDFGGGVHHPYSSMTFFKHLADLINHEHWWIERERASLVASFRAEYGVDLPDDLLSCIHSVAFFNSVCIVRKREPALNRLGPRVVAGEIEDVVPGHVQHAGEICRGATQVANPYTVRVRPPVETIVQVEADLAASRQETVDVRLELQRELEELRASTAREIGALQSQVDHRQGVIDEMVESNSWKLTAPLRALGRLLR